MASGTTISIEGEGGSCSAELVNGNLTVPDVVRLGTQSILSVNPDDISYAFTYKDCAAGDKIKLTVVSPAPSATTTTTTIPVI